MLTFENFKGTEEDAAPRDGKEPSLTFGTRPSGKKYS